MWVLMELRSTEPSKKGFISYSISWSDSLCPGMDPVIIRTGFKVLATRPTRTAILEALRAFAHTEILAEDSKWGAP